MGQISMEKSDLTGSHLGGNQQVYHQLQSVRYRVFPFCAQARALVGELHSITHALDQNFLHTGQQPQKRAQRSRMEAVPTSTSGVKI